MSEHASRCGFVALIGAPNAGKSTLLNAFVGEKVSIVTHKVQTTRFRVRGIAIEGDAQLIFVDTPGIFEPQRRLDRAMVRAAWDGADDADAVALVVDAEMHLKAMRGKGGQRGFADTARIIEGLKSRSRPAFLILNKVDLVAKPDLLLLAQALNETYPFSDTFMVSATTGDGIAHVRRHLAGAVPEGPWLYPADQSADLQMRLLAAEITREKLTLRLHDELPYASTVETEAWEERRDGSVKISQTIFVERERQRGIVLGAGGQTLKEIGSDARAELEKLMGRRAHLFLFVKVRERWGEDPERYTALGLDYPEA